MTKFYTVQNLTTKSHSDNRSTENITKKGGFMVLLPLQGHVLGPAKTWVFAEDVAITF